VTFLDVGQGDAAIVELPGGDVWLVDAGGVASAADVTSASATGQAIDRALAVFEASAIDLAIVSHPHPDHYLGLASLRAPVRELWSAEPAYAAGSAVPGPRTFGAIRDALASRGTRVIRPRLGALRTVDGVELTVWAPRFQPFPGAIEELAPDPVRSVNDNSLVVAITYAGRTILFSGDLEAEGEEAVVAAGLPHVDVVKVPHHGSPTSSSEPFVAATRPRLAVISCGVANAFGFPAPSVVARWRGAGAEVLRTDLDGSVTVTISADGTLNRRRYRGSRP
jgi:competence protein ComEC